MSEHGGADSGASWLAGDVQRLEDLWNTGSIYLSRNQKKFGLCEGKHSYLTVP